VATEGDNRQRVKVFYYIPSLAQGGTERQVLALISSLPDDFPDFDGLEAELVDITGFLPDS
jgi:hypothetical protein